MTVKTVGLDLAKDVFQVHCVSTTGRRIINKKIKRAKLLAFFEALSIIRTVALNTPATTSEKSLPATASNAA